MVQIDLAEASASFPSIVAQVEAGDEVVLTREGKPIARLIPEMDGAGRHAELTPEQQKRAREAIASMRARADRLNLGAFDLAQYKLDRDWGRR